MFSFSWFRARLSLRVYLFVLVLLIAGNFVRGTGITIFDASKILTPDGDPTTDALTTTLLNQGIQAAYKKLPSTYQNPITLQDISTYGSTVESAITAALAAGVTPTAVIGVYGDSNIEGAKTALAKNNVIIFGGLVGGMPQSAWNPQVIAAKMSPDGEMLLMLKYAVVVAHVSRIGFMFTTGVQVGEELVELARKYLTQINATKQLSVYAQPYTDPLNTNNFTAFAATSPAVTLVQSKPGKHMASFVTELMSNSKTNTGDILGGTFQQQQLLSLYQTNAGSTSGALLIASSVPPMTGSGLTAMTTMVSNLPSATDATANVMFYGFSSMMALAYATQSYPSTDDLYNNILVSFTQFLYQDYVIGFYGGPYSYVLSTQGSVNVCNQGGQSVWLMQYDSTLAATMVDNHTNFQPTCGIEGYLPSATRILCLKYTDSTLASVYSEACTSLESDSVPMLSPGLLVRAPVGKPSANHRVIVENTPSGNLNSYLQKYTAEVIMGPLEQSTALPSGVIAWNPIYPEPQVNMLKENEYYFTPVLEQDLITFFAFVSASTDAPLGSSKTVTVVVRSSSAQTSYINDAAASLGAKFGLSVFSQSIGGSSSPSGAMKSSGYNILIGITANDVVDVNTFLLNNVDTAVFLPYRTMSLIYASAKSGFSADVLSRVLTDSNIPYWKNSALTPLQQEMQLGLDLFRFNAFQFLGGSASPTYAIPLVPSGIMVAGDVTVGPYYTAGWTNPLTGEIATKSRNWGATTTYLVDGNQAFNNADSSTAFEFTPDASIFKYSEDSKPTSSTTTTTVEPNTSTDAPTEAPTTTPPVIEKKSSNLFLWILIVIAGLLLILLILFIIIIKYFIPMAIIGDPPKDSGVPLTIVFTDIDFSGALWTDLPELQMVAVAQCQLIIRELTIKYKCYEVYSDGNRFQIVSKFAYRAVQLAAELQVALLQFDWGTEKFDDWYRTMKQGAMMDQSSSGIPELNPEEYKALWRGLRVRVGVHSGLCGFYFQKSVRKYRYFGKAVETALRLEEKAVGGQTLVSGSTWDLLSPDEVASIDQTYLGPINIIGEDEPIGMYQINAVPGRVFGPLRLPQKFTEERGVRKEIQDSVPTYDGEERWGTDAIPPYNFCQESTEDVVEQF